MAQKRLVYQNWLVDACQSNDQEASIDPEKQRQIRKAVGEALGQLEDDERELVERFHFMGQTYREMARASGREIHRLEAIHRRAIRRLRLLLSPLVDRLYGVSAEKVPDCLICRSPDREAIDRLLAARDPTDTWRAVIRRLRDEFGLRITAPQMLIGHQKYHALPKDKPKEAERHD